MAFYVALKQSMGLLTNIVNEQCDNTLIMKIFNTVSNTSTEVFILETNCLPLRYVVVARQLMFYWNILQKPDNNDWCLNIEEDLKMCNIILSEQEISAMKKQKFKNLVNRNIREASRKHLIELKNKHSKSSGLSDDYRMQEYLTSSELNTDEKQLLFHLRIRTYDCKSNFKSQYGSDLTCNICQEEDSQQHLLHCARTAVGIHITGVQYSNIFASKDFS